MKTIEVYQNITLDLYSKPVGICVSGGADSALLLYLLMLHKTSPLHIFTFAGENKKLKNPKASIDVISKVASVTNNYDFEQHILYGPYQTRENLSQLPLQYLESGQIDKVYTGRTKNPPAEVMATFHDKNSENDERDPTVVRPFYSGSYYRPWTNLDKKDIAAIYRHYDLMDSLFPFTRSCEWLNPETHGDEPDFEHCGKCWWCEERAWGFNLRS